MQFFSQRDPTYASDELGWGPPEGNTIGAIGCLETCGAMTVWDAFTDMHYTPRTLNQVLKSRGIYLRDPNLVDYDLLPDNFLDLVWPTRFKTTVVAGYADAMIRAAVPTPTRYTWLCVMPPGIVHFVMAASPDGNTIIDPWYGKYGSLAGYQGRGSVRKTIFVDKLNPVAPPPPPPAPGPPVFPIPQGMPYGLYFSRPDGVLSLGTQPWSEVARLTDVISAADDWSSSHNSEGITVTDADGNTVYRLEPGTVPKTR